MGQIGRPKENFNPWEGWYHEILDAYSVGKSDVEIRALIINRTERKSLCHELWERWLEEEEVFSETIKMGRILSEAWWTKQGRDGLWSDGEKETTKLNYVGWYMQMKNRFGWKDRQEQEVEHKGAVSWSFFEKTERDEADTITEETD